jgi:glutamate racemase
VLGCTHYPLIKKEIRDVLGDVVFYDGSYGVSKQLERIILRKGFVGTGKRGVKFYDCSLSNVKEERFWNLLGGR